jgi:hypothetical protein
VISPDKPEALPACIEEEETGCAVEAAHGLLTNSVDDILQRLGSQEREETESLVDTVRTLIGGMSPDEISTLRAHLFDGDTVLRTANGSTDPDDELSPSWREGGYPYRHLMSRRAYEKQKYRLQVELLKLQAWVRDTGQRVVILLEGRDAAGKGGAIKRFMEHLNPRGARVVALEKPSERERGQWYFQRYVEHLPTAGEIVLFDRSWYNRAGVERVMGFCTPREYDEFV